MSAESGLFTLMQTPDSEASASLIERKSEFVADACHVGGFEEALRVVAKVRARHPKARHVAYAAICGGAGEPQSERMGDDGEPSGTAGKPILDVLRANGLTDAVITVTRYFGGVLLGSGGLIRAYSTAASLVVRAADIAALVACRRYRVELEYAQFATLNHMVSMLGGKRVNERFAGGVTCEAEIPLDQAARFEDRLREYSNGQVTPENLGMVYRVLRDL